MEVHLLPTTKCPLVSSVQLPSIPVSAVRAQYGSHHVETKYFLYSIHVSYQRSAALSSGTTANSADQWIMKNSNCPSQPHSWKLNLGLCYGMRSSWDRVAEARFCNALNIAELHAYQGWLLKTSWNIPCPRPVCCIGKSLAIRSRYRG